MKEYNDKVIFVFEKSVYSKEWFEAVINNYSREDCESLVEGQDPLEYSPVLKHDASKYDNLVDAINGLVMIEHYYFRAFGF